MNGLVFKYEIKTSISNGVITSYRGVAFGEDYRQAINNILDYYVDGYHKLFALNIEVLDVDGGIIEMMGE